VLHQIIYITAYVLKISAFRRTQAIDVDATHQQALARSITARQSGPLAVDASFQFVDVRS